MANENGPADGVGRRTVLHGLAAGFAGALAAPHASSIASGVASTAQDGTPAPAASQLLGEHDLEILESLSELLVPGSTAAGVPALMDRVASVETPEFQREFLASLRAFEGEARARHAASWTELDDARRTAIVRQAASGSPPELHDRFVELRDAVAETYFATEPGMRKLGWTPRTAWRELPECEHSGDDHR